MPKAPGLNQEGEMTDDFWQQAPGPSGAGLSLSFRVDTARARRVTVEKRAGSGWPRAGSAATGRHRALQGSDQLELDPLKSRMAAIASAATSIALSC